MNKLLKLSFLACLFVSFCNANDETYIFEAKGEFAKELKALVEKHSKDEDVEVNVYKTNSNVGDSRFLGIGINKNIDYSAEQGKKIYDKKCLECHGEKGTKRSYVGVRKLSKMSGKEIYYSFQAYYSDPSHGKAGRVIMQPISASTSSEELGYIIAYLKGEDDYIFKDKAMENTNISRNPTNQGTYLK
ncbi:c-type cytochrome [Campylobacter ureolyticus]|uniref:c-type cytochrome n=1 Tax=Campylobacter ureolyticus TaxID=827 RepID=UPI00215A11F8|nr:c-type cytochrome [Campylobacter ureolyticus]MCR8699840.1 c-type cytochrome [Campylobacter ureolyticus]MCZ6111387.1 c-type cytochrome [Campylobacter ureolyticus]MDK8322403.1 c-type cytochrome [Campylobacter ureolyticus]